jgi:hypothetical protein
MKNKHVWLTHAVRADSWQTVQMHFSYLAAVAAAYHSNSSNEHGDLNWRDIVTIFRVFTSELDAVIKKSKDGQVNAVCSFPLTIRCLVTDN